MCCGHCHNCGCGCPRGCPCQPYHLYPHPYFPSHPGWYGESSTFSESELKEAMESLEKFKRKDKDKKE